MINNQNTIQAFIDKYAIWLIVVIAAFFRLINLHEMALTNDELSALSRTHYHSLKELIRVGVVELDMHPPLVQIFVFYYTKIFGTNVILYKLPFILIGLYSIIVAYQLISSLFNKQTGLMVAMFMATSQYFIVHGQTARMYAPGLLLTLLFVQQLFQSKPTIKHYVVAAVYLFLVANTHYMALVTCAFAGVLYLILYRKNTKQWLIGFLAAALMFLIEFPLLLPQFKQGGLSWLGVPDKYYLMYYLQYVAQYHVFIYLFLFLGVMATLIRLFKKKENNKNSLYCLLLFVLAFVFPFLYSQWRAPILQYSVLLFGAVFLVPLFFYGYSQLKPHYFLFVLACLMLCNSYALVYTRKHYRVFYHQAYKASVHDIKSFVNNNEPVFLTGNRKYYFDYYFKLEGLNPRIISAKVDTLGYVKFYEWLWNHSDDTLVISHGGVIPYEYPSIAALFYHHLAFQSQQSLSETFVFTGRKKNVIPDTFPIFVTPSRPIAFEVKQDFRTIDKVIELEAFCFIQSDSMVHPILELMVHNNKDEQLYYGTTSFDKFQSTQLSASAIIMRPRIELMNPESEKLRITARLINEKGEAFKATPIQLSVKKGNGILYSTLTPVIE